MTDQTLGQLYSLLTALTWAFAVVLFKKSGERMPPLVLNLFKNTVALALLLLTHLAIGDGWETIRHYPREDFYILVLSGFVGIAVADTLFFQSLNLVGVGISAIVDCLYSPFVILCSFLVLTERLTLGTSVGAGLILTGVLMASRLAPPRNRTRGELILGMVLGAMAMGVMAIGIAYGRLVLVYSGFPLLWTVTLRVAAGTVGLALWAAASPRRTAIYAMLRPSRHWKHALPGTILGGYVSMILWVAGFKYTSQAAISGILNQTATVFVIILAAIFLKESITLRKLIALALALSGVIVVTLNPW